MKNKVEDQLIIKIRQLFEIREDKKIDVNTKLSQMIDLDSLNQLKLIGFIDENSNKKLDMKQISKIKKVKDIFKIIND